MLPDSMKGFAPVIRGTAHSNASYRSPEWLRHLPELCRSGAFEINDLYPTGGSGDLNVTVKETDGSEQHFVVPYASVPVLQREGRFKYSLTAGAIAAMTTTSKTPFMQGTAIYGLPYGFTVYGGVQASQYYDALALGSARISAIRGLFGGCHRRQIRDAGSGSHPRALRRIRYSKDFATTGTHFSIAGYRYNSKGFYTLQDTLDSHTRNDDWETPDTRRSREEATVDQSRRAFGSLTLSRSKRTTGIQAGDDLTEPRLQQLGTASATVSVTDWIKHA